MNETTTEHPPFLLILIPVFYGFMTFMSTLGLGEVYILFSVFLPRNISIVIVALETSILLYLTIGMAMRSKRARTALIYYNLYAIADILTTLALIDKEKLAALINAASSSALQQYANINLIFCFILYIIYSYVKKHEEYFTK